MPAPDASVIQNLVDHLFAGVSDSRARDADFSWEMFPQMAHDVALNVLVDETAAQQAEQYAYDKTVSERLSSDPRTHYSMGFVMSEGGSSLLLLEKGRPQFLKGKWVGIGGHVDDGETFEQAMARELPNNVLMRCIPRVSAPCGKMARLISLACCCPILPPTPTTTWPVLHWNAITTKHCFMICIPTPILMKRQHC